MNATQFKPKEHNYLTFLRATNFYAYICDFAFCFLVFVIIIMFLFCFYPQTYILNISWTYIPNISLFSSKLVNIFVLKNCPLFAQILITCLKCSRVSFLASPYNEKMSWGEVWAYSFNFLCFVYDFLLLFILTMRKKKLFFYIIITHLFAQIRIL